jgi:hypothetical protein
MSCIPAVDIRHFFVQDRKRGFAGIVHFRRGKQLLGGASGVAHCLRVTVEDVILRQVL